MRDDLYFVPILAHAVSRANEGKALEEAFLVIQELGSDPRYERGWEQFQLFMNAVADRASTGSEENCLATPQLNGLVIEKEGEPVKDVLLPALPAVVRLAGVRPGFYQVRLSTGRVLWEEVLTDEDLLWSRAFPGQALKLAADTGADRVWASREFRLLDGEVVVRVCPGLEAGHVEIRIVSGEDARHAT